MARKIVIELSKLISTQGKGKKRKIYSSVKELYLANRIESITDLNHEEIVLLAGAFRSGYITDINQDAIHSIVNSSNLPARDILLLENFGDSLLTLKIELANKNVSHKLSFHPDLIIAKHNIAEVVSQNNFLRLSKTDLDYIFAIAFTIPSSEHLKNLHPLLVQQIKNSEYDYLSYFSTEGIIAAEKLGLDIGYNQSSLSYKVNVKDIYVG